MFPEINKHGRGRSRRRLVIPVLVSLVALAWWVGQISQDSLDSGAYIQQVRDVADNQAAHAAAFETLYLNIGSQSVPRETLVVTMDQLRASLEQDIATLVELEEELPVEAQGVKVLVKLALQTWRSGLNDFQSAALRVPGSLDPAAELDIRSAVARLQVGDALYKSLVEEVEALRTQSNLQGSPFPEVQFMDVALGSGASLDKIVEALRDNENMTSQQSLSIQFSTTTPALVGDTTSDGLRLLPNTETFEVLITLSNEGTDTETGLALEVILQGPAGVEQKRESLGITLDASGAFSFSGFEVTPGPTFRLIAVLRTEAGISIEENSFEFVVSPPSSTP